MVLEVFLSYARQDHIFWSELDTHLSNLKRQGIITSWSDSDIVPGTEWRSQTLTHLNTARLILLLISADFMASEFCYSFEMARAIERCQANESRVLPIILRPCDWKGTPFAKLAVLPAQGKPVTCWSSRDDAYVNVVQGIRQAIDDLEKQVPVDEMDTSTQAGNDAQSSSEERAEDNLPPSENKIKIGTATAKTIKNIQAKTINTSNVGTVNNFFFDRR